MKSGLAKLEQLQAVDIKIHELDSSSHELPHQLAALEAESEQAKGTTSEAQARIEQLGKDKSAIEQNMEDARQALERSKSRLSSIRTNREYDAVHTEISTHESTIENGKTKQRTVEESRQSLEQAFGEAQKHEEELTIRIEPQLADLRGRIAAIDGRRQELLKERAVVAAEVPQRLLRAYDNIQKRRKSGVALSYVSVGKRTCSVCHKMIEPQLVNEVRSGARLSICQSCGSILIWREPD